VTVDGTIEDTVEKGTELPPLSLRVTRADLVRYAGASGDFNPIHWSDRVASSVGLPGVIAHGMLTMALAGRLVTQWAGDPANVRSYGVRFTRPVVVPDDDEGALVEFSGKVHDVSDAEDGARVARVAITATFDGKTVLGRATAEVVVPR
jgi:acyl dehydratase